MNRREIIEIIGSWLVLSVAFGFIMQRSFSGDTLMQRFILQALPIALVAVGTGFIFHELAHKYVAIHYGAQAEFFAWPLGLGIALLSSLFGFLFAAPGAVYIFANHLSSKQNGIISLAGPVVNIVIGIIFIGIGILMSGMQQAFWAQMATYAGLINFLLAGFNLLPFGPLDGKKVFNWNPLIWAVFFIPMAAIWLFTVF